MRRAPHRIAVYALELAQEFTAFYRDCQVVGRDARGGRVVPDRAVGGRAADDRAVAAAARRQRARVDVGADGAWRCSRVSRSGRDPRRGAGRRRGRAGRGRERALAARTPRPRVRRRQRGSVIAEQRDPGDQERRRQDVDGQVEAVGGRPAEHRRAVLGHERPLDLRLGLALGDQRADEARARRRPAATGRPPAARGRRRT